MGAKAGLIGVRGLHMACGEDRERTGASGTVRELVAAAESALRRSGAWKASTWLAPVHVCAAVAALHARRLTLLRRTSSRTDAINGQVLWK